jgi:metallophosphoesterase superfamily enzyme
MQRLLLVPDVHRPYHDERAWSTMLKAARRFAPHKVIVLGDFADAYQISMHDKDPARRETFADEIENANGGLDELEAATPIAERHFIAGNHEYRLERMLRQVPQLHSFVSIQKLLRLKERGWHYTGYQDSLKIGKLYLTHDEGNAGAQAHEKARASFESNVVIGHTHRMSISYRGTAKGTSNVGAMFGWLGSIDKIDYVHKVKAQQWQHGFGIGYLLESGVVHLQAVPIVNGACVVEGKLVRGKRA